jgi:SAM-dependent methyltransferase
MTKKVKEFYHKYSYPLGDSSIIGGYSHLNHYLPILNNDKYINIADIGCGSGHFICSLAKKFPKKLFTGFDFSENSIKKAKQLAHDLELTNINFICVDIYNLDEINLRFDFFFCMGVIHHMEKPKDSISKISSILRNGGSGIFFLYGKYGRFDITRIRKILDIIKTDEKNINTLEDINILLEEISPNKKLFKIKNWLRNFKRRSYQEHFKLATLDNYLVPVEQTFNFREILDLVDNTEFKFINFIENVPGSIEMNRKYNKSIERIYEKLNFENKVYFNEMVQKPSNYTFFVRKN